jgi:hypothetical protein
MKRSLIYLLLINSHCWAQPIWHCSRNIDQSDSAPALTSHEAEFSIAALSASIDAIGVSITDLINVYSGTPVRIGGLPLSACFMPSNEKLTTEALVSLGIQPNSIQPLARRSSIVQSNLYLVTNDSQMRLCIEEHFPAVGYMQTPNITNQILPCF